MPSDTRDVNESAETVLESLPWWMEYARATGELPDLDCPRDGGAPWWWENPEVALEMALDAP
jgi:hypothetical protein